MPLEKNTVRFIDNFSTGNRGAASAELFLRAGYAVVFLHRQGSAFPFARRALGKSAEALLEAGDDAAAALARAAAEYREHRAQLLAVPFVSVSDYLFLLREAAQALAPAGARACCTWRRRSPTSTCRSRRWRSTRSSRVAGWRSS